MAITINGTTGIAGVDGSASTPSYQGADTNTGIFYPAADTIAFAEGGAEAMRLDSNGRLGINTTSPAGRLSVNLSGTAFSPSQTTGIGGGVSTRVQFSGTEAGLMLTSDMDSSGNPTGSSTVAMGMQVGIYAVSDIRNQVWWSGGYPLTFTYSSTPGGSPTERARFTSGGYFKSSDNGTYYSSGNNVHEFNQSADGISLSIYSGNTSLTTAGIAFIYGNRNTTNGTFYALSYYNLAATAYKFRVADSGTVTNTTGTYTTISDIKLKQDITDASSQWNDIKSLRIVNYR